MKAVFAAAMLLLVGVVSVLACTATFWSNGSDIPGGGNCGGTPVVMVDKSSYWAVKYPRQVGYSDVTSYGMGECCSAIPSLCWPIFYYPQALNNHWEQVVDDQGINFEKTHCYFWHENVYPSPDGLAPSPGQCATQTATCMYTSGSNGFEADYNLFPVDGCEDGFFCGSNSCCIAASPILIDISGNGYNLTGTNNPVWFDFVGEGTPLSVSWTAAGSDDAFLVLDRNGNGTIDNGAELFGNFAPQPPSTQRNGFMALAEYDRPENGGNSDAVIDHSDSIFSSLRLWKDINHDGISQPNELHRLRQLGVYAISVNYEMSRRVDRYGNHFRYRARVFDSGGSQAGRWAWDVFFVRNR